MTDAPTTDCWIRHLNLLQLVLAGIIIMTPTVWMVVSSLKPSFEVTAYPPTLMFSPTLENYVQLMKTTPFVSYAVNSLIVTIGSTSLGLLFGIPAAVVRHVPPGRHDRLLHGAHSQPRRHHAADRDLGADAVLRWHPAQRLRSRAGRRLQRHADPLANRAPAGRFGHRGGGD